MLVNARLLYISADGLHYKFSGGQMIVTVNPLAFPYSLTDQEFTLSYRDRTRLYNTFIITILVPLYCANYLGYTLSKSSTNKKFLTHMVTNIR